MLTCKCSDCGHTFPIDESLWFTQNLSDDPPLTVSVKECLECGSLDVTEVETATVTNEV